MFQLTSKSRQRKCTVFNVTYEEPCLCIQCHAFWLSSRCELSVWRLVDVAAVDRCVHPASLASVAQRTTPRHSTSFIMTSSASEAFTHLHTSDLIISQQTEWNVHKQTRKNLRVRIIGDSVTDSLCQTIEVSK